MVAFKSIAVECNYEWFKSIAVKIFLMKYPSLTRPTIEPHNWTVKINI